MPSAPFTFRIDSVLRSAIDAEAKVENRSAAYVLQQAATEYISRKQQFRQYVAELEAEADKGVFVSDEAMTAWFESLGTDHELPEPEADVFLKNT